MNGYEYKMVDLLRRMKTENEVYSVKAEFEAEGTRTEELMRLKEIATSADVDLSLKIGGCDALRDMYDARFIGIQHMIGPMVESSFALEKYLKAIQRVFPEDEQKHIEFLVNLETVDTLDSLDEMLQAGRRGALDGFVLGRGDLVESMGMPRTAVDSDTVFKVAADVLVRCKSMGFSTVMGGGISVGSMDFLRRLPEGCLDRFETRKVCFNYSVVKDPARGIQGIERALEFEFLWLSNKRNFYHAISEEDCKRIATLKARFE